MSSSGDNTQDDPPIDTQPLNGTTPHTDILQPEPVLPGGLIRHTFKQPVRQTPSPSILGLDRLARDKRSAAANGNSELSSKKPRIDDGDKPYFKGSWQALCVL
jgi:hypothetical protein